MSELYPRQAGNERQSYAGDDEKDRGSGVDPPCHNGHDDKDRDQIPARLTFPLSVNRCADASAGAPIVLLLWRALHDGIGDRRQCIGGHRRRTGAFLDFNKHGLRNRRLCKS